MSQFPQGHDGFHPGESWIVLDEQGWSSRPPTASPSRQLSRQGGHEIAQKTASSDDEEEMDSEEERRLRRLGMDRDVREALELAERSLELAGSAEEFSSRSGHTGHEDDTDIIRHSPMMNYMGRDAEGIVGINRAEDPYQGRNPPIIRRPVASVDNISSSPLDAPRPVDSPFIPFAAASSPAHPTLTLMDKASNLPTEKVVSSEGTESSFLQWFFGLSPNSSPIPIILSHVLTLAAGYYLGTRRTFTAIPIHTSSPVVASGTQNVGQ